MLRRHVAHGLRRRGRAVTRAVADEAGQSTLEYLLTLVAFVAMVVALGFIWHAARDGRLLGIAIEVASHGSGRGGLTLLQDVVEY